MDDESLIVAKGTKRTIAYAICRDGSSPAKEFLASLTGSEAAKLAILFKRMALIGTVGNEQHFRKEGKKIWAFKRDQMRVGCFQEGTTWFLTHGFKKKKDKWPKSELERAERIHAEHLERSNK